MSCTALPMRFELDDLIAQHHSAVHALLADATAQVGSEQERHAELVGRDLDPDLLVFLPRAEQPRRLLRVLDHIGERLRAGRGAPRPRRGLRDAAGEAPGRALGGVSGRPRRPLPRPHCGGVGRRWRRRRRCGRARDPGRCGAARRARGWRERQRNEGSNARERRSGKGIVITSPMEIVESTARSGRKIRSCVRRRRVRQRAPANSPRSECARAAVIVTST